ncbi:MAG: exonuclease domain-containing protein [Hyphomicrobium sp.]|uniref:exonuclease domain-containing protein n=1 Tax=Hyphomicrobium sp. TaxID=82 RepID=UPI003D138D26
MPDRTSRVNDGIPLWRWQTLVDPEEPFDSRNIKIHGITSAHTNLAPNFAAALEYMRGSIENQIVACHHSFDYEAIHSAAIRYDLEPPRSVWIDTCEVARLAWPNLENHKLATLCTHLGIPLIHHDASSDAMASGLILHHAMKTLNLGLDGLKERVCPINHPVEYKGTTAPTRYSEKIELAGRTDGPLAGHVLVCTGEMEFGERKIAELAADLGCDVEDSVTQKRTTILVMGYRDPSLYGTTKSGNVLAAEKAIAKGKNITILTEQQFLEVAKRFGVRAA